MSSTTIWCRACGLLLVPGQALLVTPTSGNPPPPPFTIHRPSVVSGCLARAAARTVDATISTFDQAAALAFDRQPGGRQSHVDASPKPWQPRPRTVWGEET